MAEIKRIRRCNHCGAILQKEDPKKPGYTEYHYETVPIDHIVYCDACYEARQINTGDSSQQIDTDQLTILKDAVASDALIVYVLDLTLFNGSVKSELAHLIKHNDVIVMGTKRDLLPEKTDIEQTKRFIQTSFQDVGINPVDICLVGIKDLDSVSELKEKIFNARKRHDIFIIGTALSGKTTIVDHLLMNYQNNTRRTISHDIYPNTNSKVLTIPLDNSTSIYELPGFALDDSVLGLVEKDLYKYIIPRKQMKPRRFRLNAGDSVVIGGLGAIDLQSGKATNAIAYFSNEVELKRMSSKTTDLFFRTNLIRRELRPVSDFLKSFVDFDLYELTLPDDGEKHDIAVNGVGWFTIVGNGQTIRLLTPRGAALKEGITRI